MMELKEAVLERLRQVSDPEAGVDVVHRRLIEELCVDGEAGRVRCRFRPLAPLCPLAVHLALGIREAVARVPGVTEQEIEVVGYVGRGRAECPVERRGVKCASLNKLGGPPEHHHHPRRKEQPVSIVYGPVPSWRLGRSLGIDLISAQGKTCSLNCVYCQLGRTVHSTAERRVFVETAQLRAELAGLPAMAVNAVTFSGTGEPTLSANLGEALDLVHNWSALRGVPTAVLTNASLLSRPDVRRDLARADLVVAKLDAPNEALFWAINQPVAGVTWASVVDGIRTLRREYAGWLALQMMFIAANRDQATVMAGLARSLGPDEVQLNTPLRPSPTPPLGRAEMADIEAAFAGLPVRNVYAAPQPAAIPLDEAETHRRRPAEGVREV